jgi:Zn-finger nucleic acid-binding protein
VNVIPRFGAGEPLFAALGMDSLNGASKLAAELRYDVAVTYREVVRRCVSCGATLVPGYVERAACERCPRCGGIWMPTEQLLNLMAATPTAQRLFELMVHNDGSPRRKCPQCGEKMDLAWIDFLQLDQCAEHGVWLDSGELAKALTSADPSPDLRALIETLQRRTTSGDDWKPQ